MAKKNTMPSTTSRPTTPRRRTRTSPATADASSHAGNGVATGPRLEEIAEAAYHRYLNRGAGDGRDFDDWLEAERELRTRVNPKSQ